MDITRLKQLVSTLLLMVSIAIESGLLADRVWVSIDRAEHSHISTIQPDLFADKQELTKSISSKSNLILAEIESSKLAQLSQLMHEEYRRCGGFMAFQSLDKAQTYLSTTSKALGSIGYSLDNSDTVESFLAGLSSQHLDDVIINLSQFHNRYYETITGWESSLWLYDHWQSLAAGRSDISISLVEHSGWPQPSVMALIDGTSLADEYVVAGGHLDSVNWYAPQTGRAPGIDDNASGIAVVSELLRLIVDRDYYPARSIMLFGYAAEEVGLLGSRQIADYYSSISRNIVGVTQFDMSGYAGTPGATFVFITDHTNDDQTQFMVSLVDTYLPELNYQFDVCGYACSDHASWDQAGYRASFPFEARFSDSNPLIHTAVDDYYDVINVAHFARLGAIYLAELAKGEVADSTPKIVFGFTDTQINQSGSGQIHLTVSRTGPTDQAASLSYQTRDSSAVAGTDYMAVNGVLTWSAGDSEPKTIPVNTNTVSSDRSFYVELFAPSSNAIISSDYRTQVTLIGSDSPDQTSRGSSGTVDNWLQWLLLLAFILMQSRKTGLIRA